MLNTHKLLYILPDLAYVAELLPAKKPNTFAVQSFRQINGEFMDDNEFIAKNVLKLFSKLEAEEYHLILPDFLFTNTIVSVKETGDAKVKKYLKEDLLPNLSLDTQTHEIETIILTEFKGESKVQLSAIEKSVLAPIRVGAHQAHVKIKAVSPLSWTVKSVVSLEPSITVLQIGQTLYCALQYIGIDQTMQAPVSEIEAIAETIKTLKGGEPNIQTIYLLSNSLVEQRLKELASDTIPIQQLNSLREDDAQMPSYVKDIIEYSMRTLSVQDFPVPAFPLGKVSSADVDATQLDATAKDTRESEDAGESKQSDQKDDRESTTDLEDVAAALVIPAPTTIEVIEAVVEPEEESLEVTVTVTDDADADENADADEDADVDEDEDASEGQEQKLPDAVSAEADSKLPEDEPSEPEIGTDSIDLSQFAARSGIGTVAAMTSQADTKTEQMPPKRDTQKETNLADEVAELDEPEEAEELDEPKTATTDPSPSDTKPKLPLASTHKSVIKHSSGVAPMLKMVFITLVVFAVTVAVGIGVGLGLLQLNSKNVADTSPVVVASPTPSPITSSPSPSPKPELDKSTVNILVVNATTKAGYAGTIKDLLAKDGFTKVTAGNAKGSEYEGNSLLVDEEDSALTDAIQEAAELDELVAYASDSAHPKAAEDASSKYDAVLVLSE